MGKITSIFIGGRTCLTIDPDRVEAVRLEDTGEPGSGPFSPLCRPLTRDEKLDVISLSLRYGSRGIPYWAFKSLILWCRKDVYPQQGRPSKPLSTVTTIWPCTKRKRHWCKHPQSGHSIMLASRSKAARLALIATSLLIFLIFCLAAQS